MALKEVDNEEKQKLISLCGDYLSNDWINVDFNDVFCGRITYGVTNKTYRCYIRSKKYDSELNDVVIHIFVGGLFDKQPLLKYLGEAAEVAIVTKLYTLGMAPKSLSVFPEGRIEKYVPGRPPTREEYVSLEFSKAVMRKLAQFHSMKSMPILKKPNLIDLVYNKASQVRITDEAIAKHGDHQPDGINPIMNFPLAEEYEWIKQVIMKTGHKLVFSHNDFNPNNILLKDQIDIPIDQRLMIIDFETNTYFYRGFDIAYFLSCKILKVKSDGKKVTIEIAEEDEGSRDELLNEYLKEAKNIDGENHDDEYNNLERLRMEVDFFHIVFIFYLVCFGRIIIAQSTVEFPLEFLQKHAAEYEKRKRDAIEKYGDPTL